MKYISTMVIMLVTGVVLMAQHQGHAGHSEYADFTDRAIKALSPEEVDGYRNGKGMGMAAAAELNGYPGPKHVLEFQDELDLTEDQLRIVRQLYHQMHAEAVVLGKAILHEERLLDSLFFAKTITPVRMDSCIARIGRLKGELRGVHLRAHLDMRKAITPEQIHTYNVLRGYAGKATQQPRQHEH